MKEITIYTSKTCGYCKKLKEVFNSNDIKFIEKNNEDFQSDWIKIQKLTTEFKDEWGEIALLTGLGSVPTIVSNGNIFQPGRDYGHPAGLINLLQNYKESSYSELRQTLEKLKTLNQNMVHAFQRVYTDLNDIKAKLNANGEDRITIKNK